MSDVDKSIRWYLAGPMTGIKGFNYPLFDEIAARLRSEGYAIICPTEAEPPESRRINAESPDGSLKTMAPGGSYGKALAQAMPSVVDLCGGIILLPDWQKSTGARIEAMTGLLCGKQFAAHARYFKTVTAVPREHVATELSESLIRYRR